MIAHSGDKLGPDESYGSFHRFSLNTFGTGGKNSLTAHHNAQAVLLLFGKLCMKASVR